MKIIAWGMEIFWDIFEQTAPYLHGVGGGKTGHGDACAGVSLFCIA